MNHKGVGGYGRMYLCRWHTSRLLAANSRGTRGRSAPLSVQNEILAPTAERLNLLMEWVEVRCQAPGHRCSRETRLVGHLGGGHK